MRKCNFYTFLENKTENLSQSHIALQLDILKHFHYHIYLVLNLKEHIYGVAILSCKGSESKVKIIRFTDTEHLSLWQ